MVAFEGLTPHNSAADCVPEDSKRSVICVVSGITDGPVLKVPLRSLSMATGPHILRFPPLSLFIKNCHSADSDRCATGKSRSRAYRGENG